MAETLNPKRLSIARYSLPTSEGFTLIETLVSLLVFSVALAAVFSLLIYSLKETSLIKDNFVASGLVQEGMEVARNIRDNDWYLGYSFGASIPDGLYRVQWNSQSLLPLAPEPYLKRDGGNGLFSYDTGNDTIFKRTVTISTVSSVEKRIIVTVTWNERGVPKSVSAEDHLFNWK